MARIGKVCRRAEEPAVFRKSVIRDREIRMKKRGSIFVIILVSLVLCVTASAREIETGLSARGASEKLMRGFENLAGATLEVPGTVMRRTRQDGMFTGLTLGMVDGVLNTVKRAFAGIWEVATFPVPVPEGYDPILSRPDFLGMDG